MCARTHVRSPIDRMQLNRLFCMPRSSGHLKEVEALRTYAKRLARESVPLRTRMRIDERTYVVDGCVFVLC